MLPFFFRPRAADGIPGIPAFGHNRAAPHGTTLSRSFLLPLAGEG